jgi:uncharacterized protein (TIGR02996 family)
MIDDPAFLQEITTNPDELGPRLRYADFLDEKLDEPNSRRAEFIRVQCALDQLVLSYVNGSFNGELLQPSAIK